MGHVNTAAILGKLNWYPTILKPLQLFWKVDVPTKEISRH